MYERFKEKIMWTASSSLIVNYIQCGDTFRKLCEVGGTNWIFRAIDQLITVATLSWEK